MHRPVSEPIHIVKHKIGNEIKGLENRTIAIYFFQDYPVPAADKRGIFAMREGMGNYVHYRPFTEMSAVMSGGSLVGMQVVALDLKSIDDALAQISRLHRI